MSISENILFVREGVPIFTGGQPKSLGEGRTHDVAGDGQNGGAGMRDEDAVKELGGAEGGGKGGKVWEREEDEVENVVGEEVYGGHGGRWQRQAAGGRGGGAAFMERDKALAGKRGRDWA